MTIRQFARLCGCNPQTLRYYDHVDLLKPVRVDPWSGYRYYEEDQALIFVKIKSLQAAGFAIDEIRELLEKDTLAIYNALEAKVAEQERRLQEIKAIRQSYLAEMNDMQRKIQETRENILNTMRQYDPAEEFGIDAAQYDGVLANVQRFFDNIAAQEPNVFDATFDWDDYREGDPVQEDENFLALLDNPDYELFFERHGWTFVKDFIRDCGDLEDGAEYALLVRIVKEKGVTSMGFINTLLGVVLAQNPDRHMSLSCNVEISADDQNHFWLLRRRA